MIRNLRTLALAMGAVFLLGGLMASSASANNETVWFEGAAGIETVTAEQEEGTVDKFFITNGTKELRCTHAHYTNLTNTVDTTESELELTPTYGGCTISGVSATVRVNGCDYRFHDPRTATVTTAGPPHTVDRLRTASAQITCPAGKAIEVESSLFGTFKCLVTVGPQTPGGHVLLTNLADGTVTAKVTLSGIHYTEHSTNAAGTTASGIGACTSASHEATGNDGTYEGVSIIEGKTHLEDPRDVWVDL